MPSQPQNFMPLHTSILSHPQQKYPMFHCAKKPVTTMLTYPWKCTVLHCNHLGNTWKPLVLMTQHFDYCPSTSEGDNQSVRCFPGGYNVKLYISRGRLAWWFLAFFVLCSPMDPHGFASSMGQHRIFLLGIINLL